MTREDLAKVHDDYTSFLPEWLFYVRSYMGGKFYRDGDYLLQHPFESKENYERRKKTAYYYNYCAPIVDIMGGYLYKKSPKRSYGDLSPVPVPPRQPKTLFDRFWWDVDFCGSSFDQFMREAQRYASIYGRVSIIVDKPQASPLTKAAAFAQDIRPYLSMVTPENLLDWQFTRLANGRPVLSFAKILESVDGRKKRYRIWKRDSWELWEAGEKEIQLLEIQDNPLGEVPIINLYNKRSGIRMVGLSDIKDIAGINRNIYYLCSDAKEIIENTAFPMLALPYEKVAAEDNKVGPKNILQFDPDQPNSRPSWLEAPHSSLAEIREWVMQDASEIARVALMGGIRNIEQSTQPWTGVAIEAQAQQLYAVLAEKADNAEQSELDILRLWAKWEGAEFKGNVEYRRDFAVKDATTSLQNAISAGTANINSLTFEKARQKKIVSSTLTEIEEAEIKIIEEEIDGLKELPQANPAPAAQTMGA
ncbi:MAG: phage portal protein [Deltaproteobacteria bacterium]|nr:phage portal protein [Deltaproteobacteria bacterium]